LYSEATGSYTDVDALPGVTGLEAEVLADAPHIYWPMQDSAAAVDRTNPSVVYPNPNRLISNDGIGYDTNCNAHKQSNFVDNVNDGKLISGASVSPHTRSWYRLNCGASNVHCHFAFVWGPGFSNTGARTLEAWVAAEAYPTSGNEFRFVRTRSRFQSYRWNPPDRDLFYVFLNSSGQFGVKYNLASNADNLITATFSNYTLPLNTPVHVVVRFDASIGKVQLFINGSLEDETGYAGFLFFGAATYITTNTYQTTGNFFIRDVAAYDYALPDSRILAHYNAGT
jgi:hypothetical protein